MSTHRPGTATGAAVAWCALAAAAVGVSYAVAAVRTLTRHRPATEPAEAGDPPHTYSGRGFLFMESVPSDRGGYVAVSESSDASGPHIWLRAIAPANLNDPEGPTVKAPIHLTLERANLLARQLEFLVWNHYQIREDGDGA